MATPDVEAKVESLISEVTEPEVSLQLDPRRSKLVRTKQPVSRFSVTDPQIVDIVQYSPTEFELIGGQSGETSLTLWFGEDPQNRNVLRYLVQVSRDRRIEDRRKVEYGELQAMVNEMFPNSVVNLVPIADKLFVRGQARDSAEAAQIMALIRGESTNQLGGLVGTGSFGNALGSGTAAAPFPGASDLPTSHVISLLEVPGEMQVMLRVRIAELTRSALRQMGADLQINEGDFSLSSVFGGGGAFNAILTTEELEVTLDALSSNGYSKILAEPNLVTLSGRPASFIAGGEFAVPTVVGVEGAAAATTSFRGFGTQVSFTPTIIDKDRIRLTVAPSFSTLNSDNSVNGIPGLNSRSVNTTVDLREGQWLAIAGLLQDQQAGNKARVPFVGDIPILETVFSRRETKREETELIVLVSPELVHPMECEETPLILPGMEVTEPDDHNFFLMGRYEGDPDCHHRSTVWPIYREAMQYGRHDAKEVRRDVKQQVKYQRSEQRYVHGKHGFSR
ncbi:MAG: pilus assembly protein N-terminal domain-containing protein [Planctomycetales bacterium]|nr:pilus assembly protein N-terminal domain-containing protein [Planctomycetales bacterium]